MEQVAVTQIVLSSQTSYTYAIRKTSKTLILSGLPYVSSFTFSSSASHCRNTYPDLTYPLYHILIPEPTFVSLD